LLFQILNLYCYITEAVELVQELNADRDLYIQF
jgi:hypothetical protein